LDSLAPVLQDLARRHVGYGVQEEHYATVGSALLQTLEQGLGDDFTPPVKAAWSAVYGVVADVMITAAKSAEPVR
jgi:hemoglobin-like flavoprotein